MIELAADEARGVSRRPIPGAFPYLWEMFCELKAFCGGARGELTPAEVAAWAQLKAVALEPFEASTLLTMAVAWRGNLPEPKPAKR